MCGYQGAEKHLASAQTRLNQMQPWSQHMFRHKSRVDKREHLRQQTTKRLQRTLNATSMLQASAAQDVFGAVWFSPDSRESLRENEQVHIRVSWLREEPRTDEPNRFLQSPHVRRFVAATHILTVPFKRARRFSVVGECEFKICGHLLVFSRVFYDKEPCAARRTNSSGVCNTKSSTLPNCICESFPRNLMRFSTTLDCLGSYLFSIGNVRVMR